jgi:DNA-binding MarR family transcriptional regulator
MAEPTKINNLLPKDREKLEKTFEVKREGGVVFDRQGKRRWEETVFIRIFAEFQESGWLAKLSPSELKVLISLALRMDEKRQTYPSIERLAHDTGYSDRQVIRTLQQLEERGLVSKVSRRSQDQRFENNLYTVLPDWIKGFRKGK